MPSDTPTFAQWRARPVFISSTFKDMQEERDYLRNHIFPRLEEKLRERRHQFEPIDLRMGVETVDEASVEARERLVLKVCLEEIQRSRPFLLVLLGDRYGWVPPQDRMEAATQEAGFKTELQGKSVTALEIEFGVLQEHPDQRRRSFFYFRDPLPYDQMPPEIAAQYSDAHSTEATVRAGQDRLEALKQQLNEDPELGPHVHRYHAEWDAQAQHVTGLEAWGEVVFEHLWAVLDEETRDFASLPPETWEQRERSALAEFIAQCSRDFTGRVDLLTQLHGIATSPLSAELPAATIALSTGLIWGACVTGTPGSGKSAVVAELYHRLSQEKGLLLLANAAGATPRGSEPDAMLRRFIGELAAALGIADPLPENAGPDEVDATFASLLARAALQTRVVVLLDALDQFDASPRGQHLTWLRARVWPANARLIATGITGTTPVEALCQWGGVEELELPALATPDVKEIARRVWARYHRQVNPAVLRVLEEKTLPDGSPAAGNPLWLTLALEQINLLDADDFARAERDFAEITGAGERLRALLVDTATRMPPDVPALYGWLLEQTEKTFGAPQARAFAVLIALGRLGWRETDLIPLIPTVAALLFPSSHSSFDIPHSSFSDLDLASIRRGFRAHLARRGAAGQLDFFHAQMRKAVQARALGDAALVQAIHGAIADHLECLPEDDSTRTSELMVHLVGLGDQNRAAKTFGRRFDNIAQEFTTISAAALVLAEVAARNREGLQFVVGLPTAEEISPINSWLAAERLLFVCAEEMKRSTGISTWFPLVEACNHQLQILGANEQFESDQKYSLMKGFRTLGDSLIMLGRFDDALSAFTNAMQLGNSYPSRIEHANRLQKHGIALCHEKIGDILMIKSRVNESIENYRAELKLSEALVAESISSEAMIWMRQCGVAHTKLSQALHYRGDHSEALVEIEKATSIFEKLQKTNPSDNGCARDLGIGFSLSGAVLSAIGQYHQALTKLIAGLAVRERLAQQDPANPLWQRDLNAAHNKIASVLCELGEFKDSIRHYEEASTIAKSLVQRDPCNAIWLRDLLFTHYQLAEVACLAHMTSLALVNFSHCSTVLNMIREHRIPLDEFMNDVQQKLREQAQLQESTGKDRSRIMIDQMQLLLSIVRKVASERGLSVEKMNLHEKVGLIIEVLQGMVGVKLSDTSSEMQKATMQEAIRAAEKL